MPRSLLNILSLSCCAYCKSICKLFIWYCLPERRLPKEESALRRQHRSLPLLLNRTMEQPGIQVQYRHILASPLRSRVFSTIEVHRQSVFFVLMFHKSILFRLVSKLYSFPDLKFKINTVLSDKYLLNPFTDIVLVYVICNWWPDH